MVCVVGLSRWPLICVLVLAVRLTTGGLELRVELDSLLCPAVEEMKGKIIDVHRSLELGAVLLDGSWKPSLDHCVSECCHKFGCDLALYKNDGVSQSGKNCYFIKCTSLDNCVMVEHDGFTSVAFRTDKEEKSRQGPHTDNELKSAERDRTDQDPLTPSTVITTTSPTIVNKDNDYTIKVADAQPTTESKSDSDSKPNSNMETSHSSSEVVSTKPMSESPEKSDSGGEGGPKAGGKSAQSQDGPGDGNNNGRDDCGKHGCDGSGVIGIVVVACVCFVVIVLVVTVLLKKVVTDNRKKRFKNVDYLINGMYT